MPVLLIIAIAWIAVSAAATFVASLLLRAASRADHEADLGVVEERVVRELVARHLRLRPERGLHSSLN